MEINEVLISTISIFLRSNSMILFLHLLRTILPSAMSIAVRICRRILCRVLENTQKKVSEYRTGCYAFYWKYSDPSFLDYLMKESFNYDLRKNEGSNQDIWFYYRLMSYLTVWTLFGYQIYGNYYYWSDQSRLLQYGLYMSGSGFPKNPIVILATAAEFSVVKAVTSLKILTHDPGIHFAMAPIRAVAVTQDTTIPRHVRNQVRQRIRPMVAIALAISMSAYFVYFAIIFDCFLMNLKSPMTLNTFLIFCFWTVVGALNGRQLAMNAVGLIVTLEVISLTLRLSAENTFECSDHRNSIRTPKQASEVTDKKEVLKKFSDGIQLVTLGPSLQPLLENNPWNECSLCSVLCNRGHILYRVQRIWIAFFIFGSMCRLQLDCICGFPCFSFQNLQPLWTRQG